MIGFTELKPRYLSVNLVIQPQPSGTRQQYWDRVKDEIKRFCTKQSTSTRREQHTTIRDLNNVRQAVLFDLPQSSGTTKASLAQDLDELELLQQQTIEELDLHALRSGTTWREQGEANTGYVFRAIAERYTGQHQTGSTAGRHIADNGMVLTNLRDYCRNRKLKHVGVVLDQEMAYDRVHPDYLEMAGINMHSARSLSVLGRATIVNALILSRLWHLAQNSQHTPPPLKAPTMQAGLPDSTTFLENPLEWWFPSTDDNNTTLTARIGDLFALEIDENNKLKVAYKRRLSKPIPDGYHKYIWARYRHHMLGSSETAWLKGYAC
ncbi:hypothetical protein KI688_003719 [Linnemannia hyalina]|uniref:Reverse transcriptase domain-containing protein n=1 Tax=Linnemannia hyalina TaxID=64524 RepID=A0A9P7XR99_9FUNG|nr:hypothetical protein KI688_003719 [Linnemannia hyalina]